MSDDITGAALVALGTLTSQTTEIVAAYVAKNPVPMAELPKLIASTHAAVTAMFLETPNLFAGRPACEPVEKPTAAEINGSVQRDGITSFLDGKPYKSLKRHLTAHGHTPASYKRTFGLPDDYPMVARSYSEARSALAKSTGLGVRGAPTANALAA